MKPIYKRKGFLAWAITSAVVATVAIVGTSLANTVFDSLLNFAFGGPTNIYAKGQESAYNPSFANKTESLKNANEVNLDLNREGMVLLKNENNALPLQTPKSLTPAASKPKISIFGKNSVNIAIGGSGSGAASGKSVDLYQSFEEAGYEINPTLKNFYLNNSQSGNPRAGNSTDLDTGDTIILSTAETPQSKYTAEVKNSYSNYNDAAVVVLTRIGGEGFDLPRTMKGSTGYRNEDDHFLQLDQNETDLLENVCQSGFKRVIVVLNSGSAMELTFLKDPAYYAYQDKIDAAIWMGYPGNSGATALGEIFNGTVNPSGRTVDTFAADFKKDPTWNNFGDNRITGNNQSNILGGDQYAVNGENTMYYFVDYEEGVYVGYRYYETRGETDGEEWYDKNVVYPFGYGLSYTDFSWQITNKTSIDTNLAKDKKFTVTVEVTNNGNVSGKDVVQLYMALPYNNGGIEKPSEVLVGFKKTPLIEPGQKEEVTIEVDPYSFASYDYKDANKNGFSGYELEKGTYTLCLNKNAHQNVDKINFTLKDDETYAEDPVTGNQVENLYTDQENPAFNSDTALNTILSRSDWNSTWPTSPTDDERNVTEEFINMFKDTSTNNPMDYDSMDYPMLDGEKTMKLRDMLSKDGTFVGSVDYDDERWDALLDQMNFGEALKMFNYAAYQISEVNSISLPQANCADGPVGWTSFVNKNAYQNTCSYACGVIVASTWNEELVQKFGEAVGEEGLVGDGSGNPYTGWYAPAMNIHRSPFGGRNFEYFSEDPLLSGKIAAAEVKGCNEKGVVPFIKHFALNEQETHRSITGDASWVNEQAMREIFLKPFEICVKEGGTRGVMSSFNRIGTRWTGGDYRLLTTILREEWGFRGAVICDFNTIPSYMNAKQMAYAGGDLNLATMPSSEWKADESSTGDVVVLRNALKNVAYAFGNSNLMKGDVIGKNLALWQVVMIVIDCVIFGAILIWGGTYITLSILKDKKNKSK